MDLISGDREAGNARRKDGWIAGGPGRVIEEDGVGWWEAREHGVLVKRRQCLGDLMDALAARQQEMRGK